MCAGLVRDRQDRRNKRCPGTLAWAMPLRACCCSVWPGAWWAGTGRASRHSRIRRGSFWAYVRGRGPAELAIGHSPLGSASVYALLAFLAAQVATGLFSADGEEFAGPLNIFVSNATARLLTAYHKEHRRARLDRPRAPAHCRYRLLPPAPAARTSSVRWFTATRNSRWAASASRDDWRSRLLAAVLLVIAACGIAGLVSLGGG